MCLRHIGFKRQIIVLYGKELELSSIPKIQRIQKDSLIVFMMFQGNINSKTSGYLKYTIYYALHL